MVELMKPFEAGGLSIVEIKVLSSGCYSSITVKHRMMQVNGNDIMDVRKTALENGREVSLCKRKTDR